jgi:hypothetical protein
VPGSLEVTVAQLDEAPLLVAQARGLFGAELRRGGRVGSLLLAEARDRGGLDDDRCVHGGRGRRRLRADRREILRPSASTAVASSSSSSRAMRSTAATSATIAAIAARSGSTTFSDTLRASPTRTPSLSSAGHRLRDRVEVHGRATARRLVGLGLVERVRLGG